MKKHIFTLFLSIMATAAVAQNSETALNSNKWEVRFANDYTFSGPHFTLTGAYTFGNNTIEIGPKFLVNRLIRDTHYYQLRNRFFALSPEEHFGFHAAYQRTLKTGPFLELRGYASIQGTFSPVIFITKVPQNIITDVWGRDQLAFYEYPTATEVMPHFDQGLGLEVKVKIYRNLWWTQRIGGGLSLTHNPKEIHVVEELFPHVPPQPPLRLDIPKWSWSLAHQASFGLSYRW